MDLTAQKHIHRLIGRIALILIYAFAPFQVISSQEGSNFPMEAMRLNGNQPIITKAHFLSAGASNEYESANINGPSVIRIPDWIPASKRAHPKAVYYLYFAHHLGDYIRLAWAENLEGPWTLYKVADSIPLEQKGVLSLGEDDKIDIGNGLSVERHIASPDMIVDDKHKRIIMYFHGFSYLNGEKIGQRTFVATSPYGLD
ncbi:hypothetical protein ACFLTU_10640, partial [Bacteroidota bacterium]